MEKLKEAGKDEEFIKKFQKGVQGYYTSKIVPNFSDLDFYTGESMDPDGMYVVLSKPVDYVHRIHADLAAQGRVPQLPRGRYHTICHYLEAWLVGDEGLDARVRYRIGFCSLCPTTLVSEPKGFSRHAAVNQVPGSIYECNED